MASETQGILNSIEAGNKGQLKAKIDGKFYTAWPDSEGFNQLQDIKPGSPVRVAYTEKPNPNPQYGPYKNIVAIEMSDEPLQASEENVDEDVPPGYKNPPVTAGKVYTFGNPTTAPAPRAAPHPSKFSNAAKEGYWEDKSAWDRVNSTRIGRQSNWNSAIEVTKILVQTEAIPDSKTLEGIFKQGNDTDNLILFMQDIAHRIEKDVTRQ